MTSHQGKFRRALEWAWKGRRLRELKEQRPSVPDRGLLEQAQGAAVLAWRVLAGLEPVPASTRAGLALPILAAGLEHCRRAMAPTSSSFAALFDDPDWLERFSSAGLSADRQAAVKAWLLDPSGTEATTELAKSSLVALRAALESVHAPERAIRRVLWRRLVVTVFALLGSFGLGLLVFSLLKPPRPPDLAAGKPWKASSAYPGFSTDGVKPARPVLGLFFSTNDEPNPWWQVDLQAPIAIGGVEVENRSDCCAERAHPLVLELSLDGQKWREVARQDTSFRTWEPKFSATPARFVRLRSLRRTNLHLKNVSVFGAPH
jgi:hypothetical protein